MYILQWPKAIPTYRFNKLSYVKNILKSNSSHDIKFFNRFSHSIPLLHNNALNCLVIYFLKKMV